MSKVANIKFNGGIVNTPSDVSPMDGDLNECINLVPSDGELKPVEMPVKTNVNELKENLVLAAVHNTTSGKMFVFAGKIPSNAIVIKDELNNIVFQRNCLDMETYSSQSAQGVGDEINCVNTIGNTIIIHGTKRTYYIKWSKGEYKWLGGYLPKPVFDFKMQLDIEDLIVRNPTPTTYDRDGNEVPTLYLYSDLFETYSYWHLTDNSKNSLANNLKSKIAKIQNMANEKNEFIYPFFVRYAIKLYDGSYVMHSAPLLMLPSTYKCPLCASINYYREYAESDRYTGRDCNLYLLARPSKLLYKFMGFFNSINKEYQHPHVVPEIDDWSDIIKGVDIFISKPISTYEESYYDNESNVPTVFSNYKNNIANMSPLDFGKAYSEDEVYELWDYFKPGSAVQSSIGGLTNFLPLQSKGKNNLEDLISSESIFYKAKEYGLEELSEGKLDNYAYFNDECDYNTLGLLGTFRNLPDDYINLCNKGAKTAAIYNKRLIMSNINIQAPLFYPITETSTKSYNRFVFTFVIEKPNKTIYVRTDATVSRNRFGHFIYYPDVDCKEVIVYYADYTPPELPEVPLIKTLKMSQHKGLNGAYVLMPDLKSLYETLNLATDWNDNMYWNMPGTLPPATSADRYYAARNTLIMSPVLNPFMFNAGNALEIGNGYVLGIASATLPLSEGQYGQYPLIVFTDNGIHAVGIANDGTFVGVSPVSSADSLMNAPRLGQPNIISDGQSIYFITKRGLMELRGLQVRCVSEILNGRKWQSADYPCLTDTINKSNINNAITLLSAGITDTNTFNKIISDGDAFLAFDYKHNRILVTDSNQDAHYMYSPATGKWSKLMFGADFDNYTFDDTGFTNIATLNGNFPNIRGAKSNDRIVSAVFDYNASYIQTAGGAIYDLMGAPDENEDGKYKFGFMISRPIRLGSDDYKSLTGLLHRKRIASQHGIAGMRLYGSVDGIVWHELRHLRGAGFKYYVVALYTCMKANERYSYMSVEFEEKFQNKLR